MPEIQPFLLERYFARYEFSAPFLLSPSDCESLHMNEVLAMADPECAALWENLSLAYTESPGHPLLREEISHLYTSLQPEDVLVAAPEEGIYIAMQTLLRPGDEVIAIQPAYQSLQEIARSIGCAVVPWVVQPADGAWRLDLDALERSFSPRTRLLVINFPHNPTGLLPTLAGLDAILDLARRRQVYVFSDEMYRLLEYQPEQRLPAVCDRYELGISLSGMSKALALPGLRIGWLATRAPGLFQSWQAFKDYTTICSSAPSEILALIGLRSRQLILERSLAIIAANLETAGQFFARHAGRFTWYPPQAGSVAFPRWDGSGAVDEFAAQVLEKEGVMIVPGSMFAHPGRHFRIGLGRRNFPTALERVELFLEA